MSDPKKQKMASIRERLKPDTLLKVTFEGKEEPPRFLIAYWSIRGLGAPIRSMLHAAQTNHEVALYDCKEDPGSDTAWNMKSYVEDKKWLREEFDAFMNLPFLVDSERGIVLAQTNAIFQYLARELGMVGKDEVEQAKIDEMLCEAMDLRNKMVGFAYGSSGSEEDAKAMLKNAKAHLRKFEAHMASQYADYFKTMEPKEGNGAKTSAEAKDGIAHVIPGKFTAVDFHLWEMLDQYEALCKTFGFPLWAEEGEEKATTINFQARPDIKPADRLYPYLEEFRSCFALLPENVDYLESYLHKEIPCNNPSAKFASCFNEYRRYVRGQEAPWRNKGVVEVKYKTAS